LKVIYQAQGPGLAHQDDVSLFLQNPALSCLSDPQGDTQVWLSDSQQTVFKVFDIRRRRQQWQARRKVECQQYGKRYGWAELENAQRVQQLGFPAPAPVAYLERSNVLFCSRQVVAYPFLHGHETLQDRIASIALAGDDPLVILDLIEPTLFRLASQGVFHLDLNSRNIMVGPDDSVQLIDFEYMAWNRTRTGRLYAYYLGYLFQKWLHQHVDEALYKRWFEQIFVSRKTQFDENEWEMRRWFYTARTKELSRAERYRIFI
jgi:tRNA A-37 threonylcarbamoyl transferase component Bud32